MTTPHTNILHLHDPATVIVHEAADGRWFKVLNWFYDECVPGLSVAPLKLMLGMLRHRDHRTGLVHRSRAQFQAELGLSKAAISEALSTLTTHQCRLLAAHDAAIFEPLPGREYAGRTTTPEPPPPSRLAAIGSPPRTGVRLREPEFAAANHACRERVRARPPRMVETETTTARPQDSTARGVGGWPELSLFGRMGVETGDVRRVLEDLGVRGMALEDALAVPGLTVERILTAAAQVAADPRAINKPGCLAGRLLGRSLTRAPGVKARGRLSNDDYAALAAMQHIRDTRRSHR